MFPSFNKFDILEDLFSNPELLGDNKSVLILPSTYENELKEKIKASIKSERLGLKSVDYARKKYIREDEVNKLSDPDNEILTIIYQEIDKETRSASKFLEEQSDKCETLGPTFASIALLRLRASFMLAKFLIKMGYVYEASGIIRLIVEQCAWASKIHELPNSEIHKIKPTDCISVLKKVLPKVGRFYGHLSKYSHIDPENVDNHIRVDEESMYIVYLNQNRRISLGYDLMHATDIFLVVTEYINRKLVEDPSVFKTLEKDENDFSIKVDRPFKKTMEEIKKVIQTA